MPEENRAPQEVQPLARSLDEQQLARPAVGDREEAEPAEAKEPEAPAEPAQQETSLKEERGPVGEAMDKAVEKGLVEESTVDKAEERGIIDKAEKAVGKIKDKLTGG